MVDFILTFGGFTFGAISAYGLIQVYIDYRCKINKPKKGQCYSAWCRARKICPYSDYYISKNIYGKK